MHTGIRLRIDTPAGVILEGDSDWLHLFANGIVVPDFADSAPQAEALWHQVAGVASSGPDGQATVLATIWVQPVMLPDEYPDDLPGDHA
jgi:hypothetical protein